MALSLTLIVLVALTAPMLALLSVSALEPLIARNLVDATRALYVAEAGIEWAFALLVDTADPGEVVNLAPPPGLLPWGTALITATSAATPGVVILTSTGTVNGAQRIVEVALSPVPVSLAGGSESPGILGRPRIVSWRER